MEIKKNVIISLTEKEVKNIIANHLANEGYYVSEEDVKLSVGKKFTDDYDERYQTEILYFKGCDVKCNHSLRG